MDAVTTQPPKKTNRIGLELATYRGSKTTLCAGCGHNAISERIIDAFYELGTDPKRVIKLSGIGCSSKTPAYFLGGSHGFNAVHGRMPSVATGALLANTDAAGHRRQRRRRHRRHRHRPVRPPDAPQPAARLHHRGQRLLRPDQGPVLADRRHRLEAEERRRQRPAADRHLRAGHRARRDLRRPLVLGRQEAAAGDPQGRPQPPRHRDDRRHLAVRDLQRSRGLDQELLLRQGARRAARRGQLRAVLRGHHRRVRPRHHDRGPDARRLAAAAEEAGQRLQPDRPDAGPAPSCTRRCAAASSPPASSTSSRTRTISSPS